MSSLDDAVREKVQPPPGHPQTEKPEDRARGLPSDAPQVVVDQARGHETPEGRVSAVKHLLGQQRAPRYKVRVLFATDEGDAVMWFYIRALDTARIRAIEDAHTDKQSVLGDMDELSVNAELIVDSTMTISDGEPGTPEYDELPQVKPNDEQFMRGVVSSADALRARFHWQEGLLAGLASNVRRISGWAPDRVGQAERVLVDVSGGS